MPTAIEIIENVESQHTRVTEHVKTTGARMNDIDAIFSVQKAAVTVTWSASSIKELQAKGSELLDAVTIMEEGLTKHFTYEEKIFPIILGELLTKDLIHDHNGIMDRIKHIKLLLETVESLDPEELEAKKSGLIRDVNDLRDAILSHAQHEEKVLNLMKKVYEANPVSLDQ